MIFKMPWVFKRQKSLSREILLLGIGLKIIMSTMNSKQSKMGSLSV